MVRLQHRIQGGLAVLYYYTTKNWIFKNGKMKALSLELSPEDQQTYFMDIRAVNWNEYFKSYVYGIRHYVLHEDPDTSKAVRHHQRYGYPQNCLNNWFWTWESVLSTQPAGNLTKDFWWSLLRWGTSLSEVHVLRVHVSLTYEVVSNNPNYDFRYFFWAVSFTGK